MIDFIVIFIVPTALILFFVGGSAYHYFPAFRKGISSLIVVNIVFLVGLYFDDEKYYKLILYYGQLLLTPIVFYWYILYKIKKIF